MTEILSKKLIYIKTYGCQMNSYDSDRIMESLSKTHSQTTNIDNADLILLNTCHIREKASEKLYSDLGRMASINNSSKSLKLVVAGCVAQAEGNEIIRRQPSVDMVIGPQMYHLLPSLLKNIDNKIPYNRVNIDFPDENKFGKLKNKRIRVNPSSYLSIQEGCDKFCSFCVVPYTRGAEYSRPIVDVYKEAIELTEKGTKEIILIGQNVNAFHGELPTGKIASLAGLIRTLSKINKLERISYTTSHPNDMTEELIALHGDCEKLNPYLHLPVQSGSDRILKRMNRKYTTYEYRKIIDRVRKKKPNIAVSSDFIVGYPGETQNDFRDTLKLVNDIEFAQAYSFGYSQRPGTRASKEKLQVSNKIKKDRLLELQKVLSEQQKKFNNYFLREHLNILLTKKGKREGQLIGTTGWMQSVHIMGSDNLIGELSLVEIINSGPRSLEG